MRYSQGLRHYHNKPHRLLSIIITTLSIGLTALLIIIFSAHTPTLIQDLTSSTWRVMIAYVLTVPMALLITVLVAKNQKTEDFFLPILDVAQSFPSFAILPLILATFGKDTPSIVLFLIITMIWPIIFTTISSIKTTREDLSEAAEIFQAKGYKKLLFFTIPAIFPGLVTGSIVGWGEAWEAIVGAELFAGKNGIGAFISNAYDNGENQLFFITIGILMLFIFILNRLIWLPLLKRSTNFQTD